MPSGRSLCAVGGSAVSSRCARRSSQRVTSASAAFSAAERVPVRARGVAQIVHRLALADEDRGVGREHAAQRLRELLAARPTRSPRRPPSPAPDLPAQRVLGRCAGPEAVQRVRRSALRRADADEHRPLRQVAIGLQGGRRRARVGRQQRGDQLLLAPAPVQLGVGLGLQDGRGVGGRLARLLEVLVAERRVLDQPQVAEPSVAARDRDADPRLHPDPGVGGDADRLAGGADAVAEQRVARGVGRRAAEDARGAHGVQLADLGAVGDRVQLHVVDEDGPAELDAQRVDDLLQRRVRPPARGASCPPRRRSSSRRDAMASDGPSPWSPVRS